MLECFEFVQKKNIKEWLNEFFIPYVFPQIETILFWKLECGKYSREETINY